MKKLPILVLFMITIIWGCAFTFQSQASQYIDSFTFNFLRFSIAAVVMLPFSIIELVNMKKKNKPMPSVKKILLSCFLAGLFLIIPSILQQYGIKTSSVGKSGFLTAMYIVLIPLLSLLLKKYYAINAYIAPIIAMVGVYFLSVQPGNFKIESGDFFLFGCAFFFAIQIMYLDYASKFMPLITLSFGQFLVAGLISLPLMLIIDKPTGAAISNAIWPLLYVALMSSCIAYTLQIVCQKYVEPTLASLIMSLESVVSVIFALIVLKQVPTTREIIGSVIMFCAVIFAQLPAKWFKIKRKKKEETKAK